MSRYFTDCLGRDEIQVAFLARGRQNSPDSAAVGKRILELGLPHGLLVMSALVRRNGAYFVPDVRRVGQSHTMFYRIAMFTGLRYSEIKSLKIADVHLDANPRPVQVFIRV